MLFPNLIGLQQVLLHFYLFLFSIYLYRYFIYLSSFCRNRCQVFVTQVFVTQDIKEIYLFNAVNCFIRISKRIQCQNLMLPK